MPTLTAELLAVRHCCHKERTRFALEGIHTDQHGLVATDGKVMAWCQWESPPFDPFVIDKPTVKRLAALVSRRGNVELDPIQRTADGEALGLIEYRQFPPYREVLPADTDGEPLDHKALDRACRTLRTAGFKGARFRPDGNVSARGGARSLTIREDYFVASGHNGVEVGFDPDCLRNLLKAAHKRTRLWVRWPTEKVKPLVVTGDRFVGLCMPLDL